MAANTAAVATAVAPLYASGMAGLPLVLALVAALGKLIPRVSDAIRRQVATMVGPLPALDLELPRGPARRHEDEMACAWLALYVIAACRRLAKAALLGEAALAQAWQREQVWFQAQKRAEERRLRAATLQDMTAVMNSDRPGAEQGLLGWRAVIDGATTPECRWANGKNFRADRMPLIGFPGAVHPRCRCSAGPMVPGAALIPSA